MQTFHNRRSRLGVLDYFYGTQNSEPFLSWNIVDSVARTPDPVLTDLRTRSLSQPKPAMALLSAQTVHHPNSLRHQMPGPRACRGTS